MTAEKTRKTRKKKKKRKKKKYRKIPALSGKQLIRLFQRAGGEIIRKTKHGIAVSMYVKGVKKIAIVPDTSEPLPNGTLTAILGPDQTNLRRKGLRELLEKYG